MGQVISLLLIGLIVIGVLTGITAFYADVFNTYNVAIPSRDSNITEFDDDFENIRSLSKDISEQLQTKGTDQEISGITYIVTTGAYNAIMLVFGSIGMFHNMITLLGTTAGIPAPFLLIIISGISLIVIFAILKSVMRWDI